MAFPGLSKTSLAGGWASIKATAGRLKDIAVQLQAASSLTRKQVLDYANDLADALAALNANTALPGILEYAKTEENNALLDLPAEYTTMRTALIAVQDWIVANFPKDGSGGLVVYTFDANKRFANTNLTAPQLSAFKTQLATLSATIN